VAVAGGGLRSSRARWILASLVLPWLQVWGDSVPAEIRLDRISVEHGLSQSSVFALTQDSEGYLWVGTERAADRYDGYAFTAYRRQPGEPESLSDNTVTAFFNDGHGQLWIGTTNGINRVDPVTGRTQRFTKGDAEDGDQLHVLEQGIVENCRGDLLFLARDGLWRIGPGASAPEPVRLPDRPAEPMRASVLSDGDGGIWVADGRRLWFKACQAEELRLVQRLPASAASRLAGPNALVATSDGQVLWASAAGLHRFDAQSGQHLSTESPTDHGMEVDKIDAVAIDDHGRLWLAMPRAIVQVDLPDFERWRTMAEIDSLPLGHRGGQRLQVARSGDGLIWVAGHFGVGVKAANGGRLQILDNDPADPSSLPMTFGRAGYVLHADDFGVVWIGANLAGLARYVPQMHRFEHVRDLAPGADNIIRGVAEQKLDGESWVWTGSAQSGLRLWRRDADGACGLRARIRAEDGSLPATPTDVIAAMARHPGDGRVWAVGNEWVARLDAAGPEVQEVPFEAPGPRSGLTSLAFAPSGDRVYVAESGGIWFADLDGSDSLPLLRSLPIENAANTPRFHVLLVSGDGRLIAGGRGGLSLIDPEDGSMQHFLPGGNDPLAPANFVFSLLEYPEGTLWIGTRGGGLARVSLAELDRGEVDLDWWTRAEGLVDDTVYALLPDHEGRLWLSSNRGLTRLEPEMNRMQHYGRHDGLGHYEFNGRVADIGPSGQFYFGGVAGFNTFRPEAIVDHPLPPRIQLQSIRVNGETIVDTAPGNPLREFELSHSANYLVLDFVGLHYAAPDRVSYAYRLAGLEGDWVEAGELRQARYPALPPGTYHFEVRAANSDGVWSEPQHLLTATIHPPPWLSPLAWLVYAFILTSALAVVATLVVRRRRALEALIARRTRELAERNRTISKQSRQLEEALEARTTLFANVSHEFRTPLTLVEASLDKLARRVGDDDPAIGQGRRYLRRLQRLVEQVLDLSRMRLGVTRAFGEAWHMTPVVQHTVEAFRTLAEQRGLHLESRLEQGWVTRCRQEFVERILLNLLNNAIKYSHPGGTVSVHLGGAGGEVVLEVSDDGPGIPMQAQQRVFERFHRLPASERGSAHGAGIGLALVREATQAMQGRLELDSDSGQGCRFRVCLAGERSSEAAALVRKVDRERLVLETESMARPNPVGRQAPEGARGPSLGTALVVEDNDDLRRHLVEVLDGQWQTVEADNGRAGLEAARSQAPDLIVGDIMMPDMDGLEMLGKLRSDLRTSHIPVLLLTARQDQQTRMKGLALSADDFLAKPFDAAELRLRLKRMIDNRHRLREQLLRDIAQQLPSGPDDNDSGAGDAVGVPSLSARDRELLAQLDQWLNEHYTDASAGMDDLCRALNVEARTLQRKLKALLGKTPAECLRGFRLEKAAAELRDSDRSITDIALSCGFSTPQYFARQFRRQFGQPPSEWRLTGGTGSTQGP
jgi:signal transduction histidine kinase/CheY-like chemotaxis protein/ligand-binding sensor domain-containing protein